MLRVALYIRVSTDEQALHGDSIRTQQGALREYAIKNNYQIVDYYIDEGHTATNLKRPSLQRLLDDVKNKKIDMILFTKIDRWSRGVRNYYKLQDVLDKNKVDWKTIFESYDTTNANGRLHINIMLSVAENESAQTSERIKAVFKNKLSKGEVVTGNVPKGYRIDNKKLAIDEDVAPMIKDIFNYYEANNSLSKLVDYIQDNYYHIHYSTLKRILTNPLYTGTHVCDSAINLNYCEPIIDKEQFDKIQRIIKINKKRYSSKHNAPPYIFSSMVVCKECGHKMVPNRQVKYNKTLGNYYYNSYKCQHHFKEKACKNNYYCPEKNILEKHLLDNIQLKLENYIKEVKAIKNSSIKKNNNESIKINAKKKIKRLRDLYLDELITKEDYKKEYELLNSKVNTLEEIKEEHSEQNIYELEKFLNSFPDILLIYDNFDNIEKRRLWMSIIDHIDIGKDKVIDIILL